MFSDRAGKTDQHAHKCASSVINHIPAKEQLQIEILLTRIKKAATRPTMCSTISTQIPIKCHDVLHNIVQLINKEICGQLSFFLLLLFLNYQI